MQYVTLKNGIQMPQLGYGVYQVGKETCERCVLDALETGYRLIDTAQAYGNEKEVGDAIRKSGIPRKEIFLTTKVWIDSFGYDRCKESVEHSMEKLGTDYVDLFLLHQPFGDAYGAWRALEEFYEKGRVRAIGVSNFYADRFVEFSNFNKIAPMVNQIEVHPLDQQAEQLKWAEKYGARVEAWAPFGEGRGGLFENEILKSIGQKYGKTTAQVMLRWNLQRGVIVIPKSVHRERMEENFSVFDFTLDDSDMQKIAALDQKKSAFFSHQDPATVEWFASFVAKSTT